MLVWNAMLCRPILHCTFFVIPVLVKKKIVILVSEMSQTGFFTDFIENFHKIIVWCACVIYCNDRVLKGSNCLIICLFLEDVFILTFSIPL